jgi:hypothetical protein
MHQVAFLPRDRCIGPLPPLPGPTAPILKFFRKFPPNVDKKLARRPASPP